MTGKDDKQDDRIIELEKAFSSMQTEITHCVEKSVCETAKGEIKLIMKSECASLKKCLSDKMEGMEDKLIAKMDSLSAPNGPGWGTGTKVGIGGGVFGGLIIVIFGTIKLIQVLGI